MKTLTITAEPKPEADWVHRFRNFGEAVYAELRSSCEVNIAEIDAAFEEFHVLAIPSETLTNVARVVQTLNQKHHLDDCVFISASHAPVYHQTVTIVLDAAFGEKLWEIAGHHPIWIVGSEANRAAARELQRTDITMWSNSFALVTEEDWLGIVNTIDMHHGEYASDPPVNKVSVYGTAATPAAIAAFGAYGYNAVLSTPSGFIALQEWGGLDSSM